MDMPPQTITDRPPSVILNDVTGSITVSTASPDTFTSVTFAQDGPVLICGKQRASVVNLPMLALYGKCQLGSTVQGSKDRAH